MENRSFNIHRPPQGFGLIEIIVALVIGMLTVLIIMQTLATAEAQRRQTSGGSDANTAGSIALQGLQRDLMAAAAGMTGDSQNVFTVCDTKGVVAYNGTGSGRDISFPENTFSPVRIWDGNAPPAHLTLSTGSFDTNTDVIQIIGGGSNFFFGKGVGVGTWTDPYVVSHSTVTDSTWNPFPGLHTGDMTIAVEAGHVCVISQLTMVSVQGGYVTVPGETGCAVTAATTTAAAQLGHSAGSTFKNFYTKPTACTTDSASSWNKAGAASLGVSFTNAQLYSLGPPERFVVRAYGIINGRLVSCSPMYTDCTDANKWQVYGDGIVSLRAEYGYDANNDQTISTVEWTRTLPATPAWAQLKAMRIVLVARNKQMSRDAIAGTECAPIWSGYDTVDDTCVAAAGNPGQIYLKSGNDGINWNRYHYKIFETTVQLRNLFWNN